MRVDLKSTVVASKNQIAAELQEEIVVLSIQTGEYYGLSGVGASIWSLIQEPSTVATIRDEIVREYGDVEPERCARDTIAFLQQLADASLVELVEPVVKPEAD